MRMSNKKVIETLDALGKILPIVERGAEEGRISQQELSSLKSKYEKMKMVYLMLEASGETVRVEMKTVFFSWVIRKFAPLIQKIAKKRELI